MTIKAEVATVCFGSGLSLEGLMNVHGDFGIAVPQLAAHFQFDKNQASRDIKSLCGAGFQFDKWQTPIHPKSVNVVLLDDFQAIVRALDKKGNKGASAFVDAMLGLSLHQLFSDAFGQKFEAEDRQRWLTARNWTKHDFKPLTDMLKHHGFTASADYARFVWAFQTKLGIESGSRDAISIEKLVELQGAQVRLTTLMECGFSPWQALARL